MKKFFSLTLTLAAMLSAMAVSAQAADYSFETDGTPEYYPSSSYEDVYGSRYNYGGKNVVDYQSPELEYGQLSTTQTGVMEKIMLPGLQGISASGSGIYGISPGGGTVEIPGFLQGGSTTSPATPAFTELTQDFLLSNGAVGKISIPAIGVKNYYLWEGETTASMKKGLGHFTGTSVWNGNVAVCGHNRGAKYVIGSIKDLDVGDKITYTTSMGMGDDYIDYNLVLAQETGRPCEDRIIGNQFERLKKSAGLPNVVFHSLRHSSTTYKLKINKGDVKATQGDTGHAQSDMVTQVYAHILDEDRKVNAQKFEMAFYANADLRGVEQRLRAESAAAEPDSEILLKQLEAKPELMDAFTKKFVEQYGEQIMNQLAKKLIGA